MEVELLDPDLVHEAIEKVNLIIQRLKTAQSRQKSYTNMRHRDLEFAVGDKVFLKVSPMKGLYKHDPSHVLHHENIEIDEALSFEEEPVQILDRQVRRFRTKDVASLKVLWRSHNTEEATLEV
ncbi:uncharacterized protein LOC132047420 [Lycium ferocissimum]|uniref:uncharacterized protein LOC132047420 n=1 Tax=Lycium ferocissimum TaxID=112874 RepID=UPI00281590D6|nr:uncharacterized protein LOC132047420 [Lycium ferocissimum]